MVSAGEVSKYYFGTATNFKLRYNNHKSSFRPTGKSNSTELSKYIHQLRDQNEEYKIAWSIAAEARPYSGGRRCDLCLMEKLMIIQHKDTNTLLNKRTELLGKCRHQAEWTLRNFKG